MSERLISSVANSLCSTGQRPQLITGAFVQWLRSHFVDENNIEEPDLLLSEPKPIWRDSEDTGIAIEPIGKFRRELVEKRPAIIVKREQMQYKRLGINNQQMGYPSSSTYYTGLFVGSHSVFIITSASAECEKLAMEVARELNQFAPIMRKSLQLHKLELGQIGAGAILEEAKQNWVIPLTMNWAYEEAWEVYPLNAPRLARVQMAISAASL